MIRVVDYGMGNLMSVSKALDRVGAPNEVTDDPARIAGADRLILPGVGAFGECVRGLRARGLEAPVREFLASGRPFLGICVGMQILAATSEESPEEPGLGVIEGSVPRFRPGPKIPHMGWNRVHVRGEDPLFAGVPQDARFYFVHSFHVRPEGRDADIVSATCDYGEPFAAAIRRGNLHATQFHPEKSQKWGLTLLANFARM